MTHDTDPTELTPPDGLKRSLLPPDATREQIIDRYNRLYGFMCRLGDDVQAEIQGMKSAEAACPHPNLKCAALDMAETANIGVAELHGKRRRDNVLAGIAVALILAIGTIAGAWLGHDVRSEARAETKSTLATEMPKYLKSVEDIVAKSSREGGKAGALEVIDDVRSGQLVVRK